MRKEEKSAKGVKIKIEEKIEEKIELKDIRKIQRNKN